MEERARRAKEMALVQGGSSQERGASEGESAATPFAPFVDACAPLEKRAVSTGKIPAKHRIATCPRSLAGRAVFIGAGSFHL
jgi:hypothetical protein